MDRMTSAQHYKALKCASRGVTADVYNILFKFGKMITKIINIHT